MILPSNYLALIQFLASMPKTSKPLLEKLDGNGRSLFKILSLWILKLKNIWLNLLNMATIVFLKATKNVQLSAHYLLNQSKSCKRWCKRDILAKHLFNELKKTSYQHAFIAHVA